MNERKKYGFAFKEGHKRETRKSYKEYLDEVTGRKSTDVSCEETEDRMDDENIRRSKRTPVPKRSFKLIDNYDPKESPKKKIKEESEEVVAEPPRKRSKSGCISTPITGKQLKDTPVKDSSSQLVDEVRRSGRVRKPKKFEDAEESSTKHGRAKDVEAEGLSSAELVKLRKKKITEEIPAIKEKKPATKKEETTPVARRRGRIPAKEKQTPEIPTKRLTTKDPAVKDSPSRLLKKRGHSQDVKDETTNEAPAEQSYESYMMSDLTEEDKEQSVDSAKKLSRKKKKRGAKQPEKLIVSFKKKTSLNDEPPEEVVEVKKEAAPQETKEEEDENVESQKVKLKKKKKIKEKNVNERVVDVKTYQVADGNVCKVKKKKIYRRRNGEKILVRLIKSHCNRAGEVVRMETVVVDAMATASSSQDNDTVTSGAEDLFFAADLPISPNEKLKENVDDDGDDEPKKQARKKMTKKKKEPLKKMKSRPANRVVTKDGKVVGKTTKGMKKTGGPGLNDLPLVTIPNSVMSAYGTPTEPKNAYNLFCRKYRAIIKQQHPKADFAEISRRLAHLWQMTSDVEKQEHRDKFSALQLTTVSNRDRNKLSKLNSISPIRWSETEFRFIKDSIQRHDPFSLPQYSVQNLTPSDLGAHLQLLGESLNSIGNALQEQSEMNVHGAMSVLLDSILCAVAPLSFMTSYVPEMNGIDEDCQARILDNLAYILPGL